MSGVKQIGNLVDSGNFDNPQRGRVYSTDGLSPAIYTFQGGNLEHKIIEIAKINSSQDGVIVSPEGLAKTLTAGHNNQPKIIEPIIVASRGRNPNNPSDRTPGNCVEQRLEPNSQGVCNTLTSVQKDNLVLGSNTIIDDTQGFDGTRIYKDYCPTLRSRRNGLMVNETKYRIRKLTPRECWRLMDFTDEDFDKAAAVNSNTQLYKQAGNSIVRAVLMAIFKQML